MTAGELQATVFGVKATLNVGKGSNTLTFDLYKSSACEKKTELQYILFHLANTATNLKASLDKAELQVSSLQQQKASSASGMLDLQGQKKTGINIQLKQAGMSIINPSSKKRKVARGVNFD